MWNSEESTNAMSVSLKLTMFFCRRKQELSSTVDPYFGVYYPQGHQGDQTGGKNNTNTCTSMFISHTASFTIHETAAANFSIFCLKFTLKAQEMASLMFQI